MTSKRVITFSLWGDKPFYNIGAIINAKDAIRVYPGFECWFYIHRETVPKETVDTLSKMNHVKIIYKTGELDRRMWRFLAIDDPEVEIMLSRDIDSRFYEREKLAVEEWLKTDCIFHIMRDYPLHIFAILAGMFGTRKIPEIPSWKNLLDSFIIQDPDNDDQKFLRDYIYPIVKDNAIIHATFHRIENHAKYFPIEYDDQYHFVGEYIYPDNSRSMPYVQILKDQHHLNRNCSMKNRGFILFFTRDWMDIIVNLINSILMFSKYDIETYCIGFEYNFNHPRIRNNTIQLNHLHFFNITKCKLLASVNTLFDYALLLDGDMIVNKDIDRIFEENETRIQEYKCPLFTKHPHTENPFERYSEIITSITKKTPKMEWVFSNYLFIRSQIWFLQEVLTFMDGVTDYSFYYPVPEEGIINALLTEYEIDYDLGYNYFPPGLLSVIDYYIDGKNEEGKKHIDSYLLCDCPVKIYAFHGNDIRHAEIGKQILQKLWDATSPSPKKKVITFSLWGDKPIYNVGAIINAKESIHFYPDFECWFYIHIDTVPKETIDILSTLSHVKIIPKSGYLLGTKSMMWRFEAIDDPEVAIMMSRDTDSRFTQREKAAVEEWLNSDYVFHIMRDHPHHKFTILGGMFGTRKIPEIPSWTTLIQKFSQYGTYEYDQEFLEKNIYDIVKENAMIHATFNRAESNCRFFPTEYESNYQFVGECINFDNTRKPDHIHILKNEYNKICITKIHIISTFYISTSSERNQELEEALLCNLQSDIVEKIHLFIDDTAAYKKVMELTNDSEKIKIISIGIKPTYFHFFHYILYSLKNAMCMIINADIFIYQYELKVINYLKENKWVYALSRYEYDMSCPLITTYTGSHDAYLFNSSFLTESILQNKYIDFYQNQPGIESQIIRHFYECGYLSYNPSLQLKIVHLHKSEIRNYHSEWIGLHEQGDLDMHKQTCWWVPPIVFP